MPYVKEGLTNKLPASRFQIPNLNRKIIIGPIIVTTWPGAKGWNAEAD